MPSDPAPLVRRFFEEVWNDRNERTIDELIGPDGVCQLDELEMRGPQAFRERQFYPFVGAFPDLRLTVDDILTQGDQAVIRWTATGTHTGPTLGVAPTGRTATFRGMSWIRIKDGRLAEGWQSSNIADVLHQLAAS